MSERTGIAWTDATWNPWQGCHRVSPGCDNCYMFSEKQWYGQAPDVVVRSKPHTFNLPFRLKQPMPVFTCSWSDFFIREADPWRDDAWAIIERTPHLTYQILTKRIERVAARLPWGDGAPWPHVQIITSVENQKQADRRIPRLLMVNAAVRGVSYEPALGPVDFVNCGAMDQCSYVCDHGEQWPEGHRPERGIDWLIIGGESGPHARPCDLAWIRSAVTQCRAAGVPAFVKQLGSLAVMDEAAWHCASPTPLLSATKSERYVVREPGNVALAFRHRAGADPSEWPKDLRVQEWPR